MDTPEPLSLLTRLVRVGVWTGAIVGFLWVCIYLLNDGIEQLGLKHATVTAGILGGLVLLGVGFWYGWERPHVPPGLVALGVAVAFFSFGVWNGYDSRSGGNYVADYCNYGAKSKAQRNACIQRIDGEDIDRARTEAGQFARGELLECGYESGPYCGPIVSDRDDAMYGP